MRKFILYTILLFTSTNVFSQEKTNVSIEKKYPQTNTIEYWDNYISSAQKKIDYIKSDKQLLESKKASGQLAEIEKALAEGIEKRKKLIEAKAKK